MTNLAKRTLDRAAKKVKSFQTSQMVVGQPVGTVTFTLFVPPAVTLALVESDPGFAGGQVFSEDYAAWVAAVRKGGPYDAFKPEQQGAGNPYVNVPKEVREVLEGRALIGAIVQSNQRLQGFLKQLGDAADTKLKDASAQYEATKSTYFTLFAQSSAAVFSNVQEETQRKLAAAKQAYELAAARYELAKAGAAAVPPIAAAANNSFNAAAMKVLGATFTKLLAWEATAKEFRYQVGILPADPAVEKDITDLLKTIIVAESGLSIRPTEAQNLIGQLNAKLAVIKAPAPDDTSDEALLIAAETMSLEDLLSAIAQAEAVNKLLAARLQAVYDRRKGLVTPPTGNGETSSGDDKLFGLPKPVVYGGGLLLAVFLLTRKRGA